MHRRGGWLPHRPRGPRSGPGYSVPVRHHLIGLIRPTRRHIAISPHGGLCAMPSLCGSAEATREWFRAFAAHYFLTCRPLRSRGVRHRYARALDTVRAAREWFFSAYVSIWDHRAMTQSNSPAWHNTERPLPNSLKRLERVKGIEPSSSAWKVVSKLNDFNEPCVKWRPKTVLNSPYFYNGQWDGQFRYRSIWRGRHIKSAMVWKRRLEPPVWVDAMCQQRTRYLIRDMPHMP